MLCPKCDTGGKAKKICPVSLGLAIGIVCFVGVLVWTLWAMRYGVPPMMEAMRLPAPTLQGGVAHALLALIKGFVGGFFVAILYNLFVCCCFACRKCDENCECRPEKKK